MKTENLDPAEGRIDMLSGNNSKGGYTSSHLVITSGSSIVLGAAAGAAISFRSDDAQKEPPVTESVNEETVVQEEPAVQEEAITTQEELETTETEEESSEKEALEEEKSPEEDVVARIQCEEAERQVNSWNIDATDNDFMTFMKVEGITTVYDAEGNEVEAAFAHFPDGQRFVLADLDGDGIFDSPFNLDGTPMTLTIDGEEYDLVAFLGGVGLTRSDLEDSMNDDGGYLAPDENELVKINEDDIDEDVIDFEEDVAVLDEDDIDDDIIDGTDGDVAVLDDDEFDSIDDNFFDDEIVYNDDVVDTSDVFNGVGIDADFGEAG